LLDVTLHNGKINDPQSKEGLNDEHSDHSRDQAHMELLHKHPHGINRHDKGHPISQVENPQDPTDDRKTQGYEKIQGPQDESVDENDLDCIKHFPLRPLS